MEMIKDFVAVIGITCIIIDAIISFYKIIMDDDRKQKLKAVIFQRLNALKWVINIKRKRAEGIRRKPYPLNASAAR